MQKQKRKIYRGFAAWLWFVYFVHPKLAHRTTNIKSVPDSLISQVFTLIQKEPLFSGSFFYVDYPIEISNQFIDDFKKIIDFSNLLESK